MSVRVALIGLGEVGGLLADELAARAALSAYDVKFEDLASAPSRKVRAQSIRRGGDHADAVRDAEIVISAVTAAQTVAAATASAAGLAAGAWYFDLNSASPGAKAQAAEAINATGARYVEASVMSPFPPKRCTCPILLGGPHATAFAPVARELGFNGVEVYAAEYGKTSAAKLCRSVMVKGVEALICESLLAARHYGVEDAVLGSLRDLFPGSDWPTLSRYMISRAIEHGRRRAEEMREAAQTVSQAGVVPLMSSAAAERQDWAAAFQPALTEETLSALLDAVRSQMDAERP